MMKSLDTGTTEVKQMNTQKVGFLPFSESHGYKQLQTRRGRDRAQAEQHG